ncbi:hypothetical protein BO70DRAFT_287446 [Aspergillus heteromorphus CBS 117.55]|uniref:Uncharacterized protein n=1 Tax=Aspergillus heteromorphus CBS 117.55 TaxID=1448321 RepID=A0A317WQW4_9EURO|nr:uncharacterized protein BO70DRAFT_287446 [Aspergillus heteromorphus CBS 117.55]PWY87507.1 hypothetical protein BO70DRAFT_287446 [Aspergillus heteromorphus CBS 117.55]
MLLDHEESSLPNGHSLTRELDRDRLGRGGPLSERSWILDYSSIPHRCTTSSIRAASVSEDPLVWPPDGIHGPQQPRVGPLESRRGSGSSRAGTPIRRRFTIDDQIIAEKEGKLAAVYGFQGATRCQDQPYQSPLRIRGSSSFVENAESQHNTLRDSTDTLSALNSRYSWLPEPRHNIQRFMTQTVDETSNSSLRGTSLQERSGLTQLSTMVEQHTPPIKVFGQSVTIDGDQIARESNTYRAYKLRNTDFTCPSAFERAATASVFTPNRSRNNVPSVVDSIDGFSSASNVFKFHNPKITPGSKVYMG